MFGRPCQKTHVFITTEVEFFQTGGTVGESIVVQVSYLAIGCFRLLDRIESCATQLVSGFANGITGVEKPTIPRQLSGFPSVLLQPSRHHPDTSQIGGVAPL